MKYIVFVMMLLTYNCYAINCYANFTIENNKIIFKKQNKITKVVNLKPKTPYGDRGGYIIDKVYHNSNYILIYRDYNVLGAFCHTPKVKSIEIYDSFGKYLFTIAKNPRIYVGLKFIFSRHWVVIINDVEGDISGFAFINMKKRLHKYISFNKGEEFIHAFKYHTGYTKEKDVIWIISREDGLGGTEFITEVDDSGNYKRSSITFK